MSNIFFCPLLLQKTRYISSFQGYIVIGTCVDPDSFLDQVPLPWFDVNHGHDWKNSFSIAFINVDGTDLKIEACRYCISSVSDEV